MGIGRILASGLSLTLAMHTRAEMSYRIQPLENIPGESISVSGINDHDQIIGAAASQSPLSFTAKTQAINNRGQIVGMGIYNGATQPFIMTPSAIAIPLPSPALIGAATFPLAILAARGRRNSTASTFS